MTIPYMLHKVDRFDAPVTRQQVHDLAVEYAEKQFRDEGHAEFMTIIAQGETVVWIKTPWEDDHEKAVTVRLLRKIMQKSRATAYASIQEAWTTSIREGMDEDDRKLIEAARRAGLSTLPPRLRDDALFIFSFDRDDNVGVSRYLVTIRQRGKNFLGPRVDNSEGARFAGRMANMLLPERSEADLKEQVR